MYLLFHADSDAVSLFSTGEDHFHKSNGVLTRGIDQNIRKEIDELYKVGVTKPKQILAGLVTRGLGQPDKDQLVNYLRKVKTKMHGPATISLGELEDWCKSKSKFPSEDPNAAYVVCFSVNHENENRYFRIFLSTPRLLQLAVIGDVLHADATYKLIWHGFPILVVGTSDKDRRFFPLGIGICSNETTEDFTFIFQSLMDGVSQACNSPYSTQVLVADASDAITNAFIATFSVDKKRVYCWAHVIRAIDRKLEKIKDKEYREKLCSNICQLQLCISPEIFAVVTELFFQKWSAINNHEINEFLNYLRSEWIEVHNSWYEGYCIGSPSTNNGLEATNLMIKKEQTFRERLALARFLSLVEQKILVQWSRECDPSMINFKEFVQVATRKLPTWTAAFQWATSGQSMLSKPDLPNSGRFYYVSGSNGPAIKPQIVTEYRSSFKHLNWETFDDYVNQRNGIWEIAMNENEWQCARCSCSMFLKEHVCKHTLGLAIRLKYCEEEIPSAAKNVPIGQKCKRGRPRQATSALIRD